MSSLDVRTAIKNFIALKVPTENILDLSSVFQELKEFVQDNGLTSNDPWVGIEFIGNDELPVTVPATNTQGKYRETGAVYIHVVDVAKLGGADGLLTRGEALRNVLRGERIGNVIIESVSPLNFGSGATLQFEGGYMSGSFIVAYQRDLDL